MDTPHCGGSRSCMVVLVALMAMQGTLAARPAATGAADWVRLWRKNSQPLPAPATATASPEGDFGRGIEGRSWLMVRSRYHQIYYQPSLDRQTLAEIYARIDN